MAALFRELGFQHVVVQEDLDQAAMLRALRDFEREAERADWAVVYFAGHGVEINGTNHLIPVDAHLRSDRDVPDEAVPLNRVLARIEGARRLRLVLVDACRDNPFRLRMQRVATRSISRGLAPSDDAQLVAGTMVAFAARAGQLAEDGTGENSAFVHALTRRMREPNVEISLMFRRVRDDVLTATARRQEPFIYASLPGEEIFLRRQ
ncbi:Caspase domain-containing protein [Falsiroseomonas stagni DSM 19981]|uniref:Caspase domain-containing protein n=2 Tax=Falsiroseomonas TaxID=2870713 RepID=A0A1I4FE31_9PROT|nr:Caspase domain-containing protein [Falsiroseomonas stagni DSM 19981]